MKTIVFATDFSKGSRKAALTAAQIAIKAKAKLVIFHAFRYILPYESELSEVSITSKELQKHSLFVMKRLKTRLLKKFSEKLDIELQVKEGLVIDVLKQMLEESQADLLVMGSVGDAPVGAKYFGSIATAMIHQTKTPILLVPPKTKYSFFSNAVLGLDFFYELNTQSLQKAVSLLRDFDAAVNIITIAEESAEAKANGLKVREMLKNVPHTFSVIEGDNFKKLALKFAKDNHADLIITFPKKHNFFERIFTESNTERLAFNDEIPILAVV
ncbi:universal stress protein [Emticicia sp. SJ17W-69]|uniref:universal stress protein n=1 Tax=Emticicia sp. SJ17W-69 TaxID=3421657 RepID=UPI003EBCBD18